MNLGHLVTAFQAVNSLREGARRYKAMQGGAQAEPADTDGALAPLERARLDAEQRRADRLLSVELRRQAIDWELSRLRLIAGVAMAGWVASTLMFAFRVAAAPPPTRAIAVTGWALLLAALAASFTGQRSITAAIADDRPFAPAGGGALGLLLSGLAATALALLF